MFLINQDIPICILVFPNQNPLDTITHLYNIHIVNIFLKIKSIAIVGRQRCCISSGCQNCGTETCAFGTVNKFDPKATQKRSCHYRKDRFWDRWWTKKIRSGRHLQREGQPGSCTRDWWQTICHKHLKSEPVVLVGYFARWSQAYLFACRCHDLHAKVGVSSRLEVLIEIARVNKQFRKKIRHNPDGQFQRLEYTRTWECQQWCSSKV